MKGGECKDERSEEGDAMNTLHLSFLPAGRRGSQSAAGYRRVGRGRMPKLDAVAVAKLLAEYGHRSAFRGANPYRAGAYRKAAQTRLALTEPQARALAEDRLRDIPGVGDAI